MKREMDNEIQYSSYVNVSEKNENRERAILLMTSTNCIAYGETAKMLSELGKKVSIVPIGIGVADIIERVSINISDAEKIAQNLANAKDIEVVLCNENGTIMTVKSQENDLQIPSIEGKIQEPRSTPTEENIIRNYSVA